MTRSKVIKKTLNIVKSPYMLLVPALLFYLMFWFFPVMMSIIQTFTGIEGGFTLANYKNMFQESLFNKALLNTLVFAFVSLGLQFILAVLLALLLNKKFKGSKIFLFVMIVPMALPQAAVGILWNTGMVEFGWINTILEVSGMQYLLETMGIIDDNVLWKNVDGMRAVMAIVVIDTWTVLPSIVIIILAGLQNFNEELKEAALVFGSTRRRAVKDIVVPIIKPSIVTALLLRLIAGLQMWLLAVMLFGYGRVPYLLERVVFYMNVASRTDANYKMSVTYSVFTMFVIMFSAFVFVRLTRSKDWRKADE